MPTLMRFALNAALAAAFAIASPVPNNIDTEVAASTEPHSFRASALSPDYAAYNASTDTSVAARVISQLENALAATTDPAARSTLEQQISTWNTVGFYQQLQALQAQQQQQQQQQQDAEEANPSAAVTTLTGTASVQASVASSSESAHELAASADTSSAVSTGALASQTSVQETQPQEAQAQPQTYTLANATLAEQLRAIAALNSVAGLDAQLAALRDVYAALPHARDELRAAVAVQAAALQGFRRVLVARVRQLQDAAARAGTDEPVRVAIAVVIAVLQDGPHAAVAAAVQSSAGVESSSAGSNTVGSTSASDSTTDTQESQSFFSTNLVVKAERDHGYHGYHENYFGNDNQY